MVEDVTGAFKGMDLRDEVAARLTVVELGVSCGISKWNSDVMASIRSDCINDKKKLVKNTILGNIKMELTNFKHNVELKSPLF